MSTSSPRMIDTDKKNDARVVNKLAADYMLMQRFWDLVLPVYRSLHLLVGFSAWISEDSHQKYQWKFKGISFTVQSCRNKWQWLQEEHVVVVWLFSRVQLFVTLWAVASQAPLSMDNFPGKNTAVVGISFSRVSSSPRYWTCVYTNLFQILHICVNIQYLFFSFWLTLLRMTVSRSFYVSTKDPISFLLWLSNFPLYICTTFSLSIPL